MHGNETGLYVGVRQHVRRRTRIIILKCIVSEHRDNFAKEQRVAFELYLHWCGKAK